MVTIYSPIFTDAIRLGARYACNFVRRNDKHPRFVRLFAFFVFYLVFLIHLLSVTASLGQPSLATRRLTQVNVAIAAHDNGLCMTKHCRNLKASGALDVHKE